MSGRWDFLLPCLGSVLSMTLIYSSELLLLSKGKKKGEKNKGGKKHESIDRIKYGNLFKSLWNKR